MNERDNENGSSCGKEDGARSVGGVEVAIGGIEFTLGGVVGCVLALLDDEYEWLTGRTGYCVTCGAELTGTSFGFFDADSEGFEDAILVMGADMSRLRVPPLNIALTSSQACATSSGGVPLSRKCRRHELKLAASGCTYLSLAETRCEWKMNLLGEKKSPQKVHLMHLARDEL